MKTPKRPPVTQEELRAKKAEVHAKAVALMEERAKTDPAAAAALVKLRKQGYAPRLPRDPNQLAKRIVDIATGDD